MTDKLQAKDYITQALFLLIEDKDYDSITITDIAKKAGVTRISFYRNFDSKEDILRQELLKRGTDLDLTGNQGQSLAAMFDFFNANKDLMQALFKSRKEMLLLDLLQGPDPRDLPIEAAYSFATVSYFILGWCSVWYQRGMVDSTEEILERVQFGS